MPLILPWLPCLLPVRKQVDLNAGGRALMELSHATFGMPARSFAGEA
jgi:hypothetical protein